MRPFRMSLFFDGMTMKIRTPACSPRAPAPSAWRQTLWATLPGVILSLGGCATWMKPQPTPAVGTPANGTARPLAVAASGVAPGTPQPSTAPAGAAQAFAAVIKDAKKIDGLITLYQREEKVWLELRPEDFNKPFFLSPKLASGIGEAMVFGGLMDSSAHVIEFRRVHNQVQMIARNTEFMAKPGTPEALAVAAAFSPSLLASTPVASAPHPERKSVLVDANALFINDMPGLGAHLQRAYRQNYALDGRNSAITSIHAKPESVSLQVLAHYATASIAVPQPGTPPGAPVPTMPSTLPDPRSMFVTMHYTLTRLPDQPMAGRMADARVGYFVSSQFDFGNDLARSPALRYVNRWRLEKKDPQAALSEPVKPIVYWLDRTIPLKYREVIREGILEWNKAFERVGFKDAIQVKVQPDDADFDTLDGGASVRWMTNRSPAFGAIGPSHVDPRGGEILAANIGIESLSSRNVRAARSQILAPSEGAAAYPDSHACEAAEHGAEQLGYALDVLAARGEIEPDSPEAEQFVRDYLKDTAMHEVGHTLGLRHNFRASRLVSEAQLSDPDFTRTHALTGSVMEYAPINLAAPGAKQVAPFQTTLGPYDYWAIEYAYKPLAPSTEKAELAKIAARSSEPELAYGTDEDNFLGVDPDAIHFDLGNDVFAFARKRLSIARDLFKRQEQRELKADQDYSVLRRSLTYALNDVARAAGVLARQIGGIRTLRDFPGSGRDPMQPVSAAAQREALDVLSSGLLAADSFVVSPTLQRRLAPDYNERSAALSNRAEFVPTVYTPAQRVFEVQRSLLNQLFSDAVATRILDSQGAAAQRRDSFQLSELYTRVGRDIWSELAHKTSDIPAPRRELQRDHVARIAALLLRPSAAGRADVRSLLRANASELLGHIKTALRRPAWSADAQAHLKDCEDTLQQALSAKLQRGGA